MQTSSIFDENHTSEREIDLPLRSRWHPQLDIFVHQAQVLAEEAQMDWLHHLLHHKGATADKCLKRMCQDYRSTKSHSVVNVHMLFSFS